MTYMYFKNEIQHLQVHVPLALQYTSLRAGMMFNFNP